jgi:hypothetical protein
MIYEQPYDLSNAASSSYQFPGDSDRATREGAIAVLYDLENGEDTRIFYFTDEAVKKAQFEYKDSLKYSVEFLHSED